MRKLYYILIYMPLQGVPDIPLFRDKTAAFIRDLPAEAISRAGGASDHVRVQVPTPVGSSTGRSSLAS
jgi:hypothetical protein